MGIRFPQLKQDLNGVGSVANRDRGGLPGEYTGDDLSGGFALERFLVQEGIETLFRHTAFIDHA